MAIKRAALISGGGAWGAFGGGTLARINGDYDAIIGVSTGSLLAPLSALKEWEILKAGYTSVNNDSVFDKCWYKPLPITKKGKPNMLAVVITLLLGQKSICTSNALRNTIDEFFPQEIFDELKRQNKEILVGTQNYSEIPSKIHYFSSADVKYEDFKDWMWCSANFPFFTSLVQKSWNNDSGSFHVGQWSDGGISDLIGIDQLMMKGFKEIDIILHRAHVDEKFEGNHIDNLMENINTSISAMRYDIEFEYFYERIKRLNRQGANVRVFWLPRKLSANCMVFNQKEMLGWWEEGYNSAFDANRMEVFPAIKKSL
jgi:NTE family protein